ncbi:MAG: cell division ATP-binding protein FtsE [Gammaproteobacteria bacterium]
MIRFNNVFKRFSGGQEALSDVTFHLPKGQLAFLTGHSGAGKSTVLRLIALIDRPTRGQVHIDGQNTAAVNSRTLPYYRRNIGFVFQNHRLLPDRTVFDNVALPLVIAGVPSNEAGRRVRGALDKVGLLERERSMPETLSAGEQQRVGIARAIVNRPALLLADEPTGNLDPDLSRDIMGIFQWIQQSGTTLLIATHDINLVTEMRYPRIHLDGGKVEYGLQEARS